MTGQQKEHVLVIVLFLGCSLFGGLTESAIAPLLYR
jgi:hypothetical protein